MLAPDAVLLEHDEWAKVANAYLDHCGKLMSRVVILDVPGGDVERNGDRKTDVISGSETGMRSKITSQSTSYGMAYYPWIDTTVLPLTAIGLDGIRAQFAEVPLTNDRRCNGGRCRAGQ